MNRVKPKYKEFWMFANIFSACQKVTLTCGGERCGHSYTDRVLRTRIASSKCPACGSLNQWGWEWTPGGK